MTTKVLLAAAVGVNMLAQIPEVPSWENLGALGFLGAVCLWLVTRTLPNAIQQIKDVTERFAATIESRNKTIENVMQNFATTTQVMAKGLEAQQVQLAQRQHEDSIALTTALTELKDHCREAGRLLKTERGAKT